MVFQTNDIVEATDHNGSYFKAKGVVVDFDSNLLGQKLVLVKLENVAYPGYKSSCFYPSELTLLERKESPVPR